MELHFWYYLELKNDSIYNRIRYLIGVKSGITTVNYHSYARIKVDSYDSLPLEKTLTFHNVILLIKSALIKIKTTTATMFI